MLFWKKTELAEGSPSACILEAVRDVDGLYATKSGGTGSWSVHGHHPRKVNQAMEEGWESGTNPCLEDWFSHFDGRLP